MTNVSTDKGADDAFANSPDLSTTTITIRGELAYDRADIEAAIRHLGGAISADDEWNPDRPNKIVVFGMLANLRSPHLIGLDIRMMSDTDFAQFIFGREGELGDVSIAFAGRFRTMSRIDAERIARNHGAKIYKDADWPAHKGRNFLVIGNDDQVPVKQTLARSMGITVITEAEFLRMIGMG